MGPPAPVEAAVKGYTSGMTSFPRRAFAIILAAAFLLDGVPQGVQAQVVRVAVGETGGMRISPVAGSAAGMTPAPALAVGAASLVGSFSAPAISLSPVASDLQPSASNAAAPKRPAAPKAAAPSGKKPWSRRVPWIGRRAAPSATPTAEAPSSEVAKAGADRTFDGAAWKTGEAEGPPVSGGEPAVRPSGLKAALSARLAAYKTRAAARRAAAVDEFGGPRAEPMTFQRRVGYGLTQGLKLVGIGALLNGTLRPLLDLLPWPQYLSDAALSGFGRAVLLAKYGPNEIAAGLAGSPAAFLGINLPLAVAMEEIRYRLLGFGLTFLALAAVKPFTRRLSSLIDGLPDAAGVVTGSKRLLGLGEKISRFAFPLSATLSSASFAAAHFAAWGSSPFVFVLNASLGLLLARTAYKSRGLTSPILAHLVFNLVPIGGTLIAMSYSHFAGAAFTLGAGLIGASLLLRGWLSARKERAFRLKRGAKVLAALMIVGAVLAVFNGARNVPPHKAASPVSVSATIQQAKGHKIATGAPAAAALAGAAEAELREAMVARVKPSIVNVIVPMPGGYAIGSGFILTADGVFVTNGHVVGAKKPGEFVNAVVPGVDGELRAEVLAVNHDKDLAIVRLEPRPDGKPWPSVKLAPNAPREGEEVTAIGYPRGLPFTVTRGIVSGMDDRGSAYVQYLQTDAAINPGNSGGPLFNARGEVVGVNTLSYTQSGGSDGLGFAIQASEVARVMAQYAKTGDISTAALGIIVNLSDPLAPETGLEIEQVRRGSAAEKAGLKRGDRLIGVGGELIVMEGGREAAGHVATALAGMIPGQKVTVVVLRGDRVVKLQLRADAKATSAPHR